jgi:hypothetical protein
LITAGINKSFNPMNSNTTYAPVTSGTDSSQIVEIKLWGLYLLINRENLYNAMIESSLDHGPVEKNPQNPGRITFRFNAKEWESKIKKLLYSNRVPVIVKSQMTYMI